MRFLNLAGAVAGLLTSTAALPALARGSDSGAMDQATEPDNTAMNKVDQAKGEPTADQQSNSMSDVKLAAKIRRSLMRDKSLSTNGHNVKIIAQNGAVTLKGPVNNTEEKATVEHEAARVAGAHKVTSELSVQQ